jgi:hypothetical protein
MQFSNPRHYQQSSMLFGKQGDVNYTDDWVDKMLEVVFNAFRQLGGCKQNNNPKDNRACKSSMPFGN